MMRSYDQLVEQYNQNYKREKAQFGLPDQIRSLDELIHYQKELENVERHFYNIYQESEYYDKDAGENATFFRDLLVQIANEYTGYGVDFSLTGKAYRYTPLTDVKAYQKMIKQLLKHTNAFNDFLLVLPETYDLILKSDLPFNNDDITRALFLAYLDEFYVRSRADYNSRFVFTFEQLKKLIARFPEDQNKGILLRSFLAMPFIPARKNRLFRAFRSTFFGSHKYYAENRQKYLQQLPTLPPYKNIFFNINGSSLAMALIGNPTPVGSDYDIRLDQENGEYIDDDLFTEACEHYRISFGLQKLEKILLSDGSKFKYQTTDKKGIRYDLYRASFGFISNYHVPPVRVNYSDLGESKELTLYPSAIIALITGICVDLRYFTIKTDDKTSGATNPMNVVQKYYERGFSFFLSDQEMLLFINHYAEKNNLLLTDSAIGIHFQNYYDKNKKNHWKTNLPREVNNSDYKKMLETKLKDMSEFITYNDFAKIIDPKFRETFYEHAVISFTELFRNRSRFRAWLHSRTRI
jgi:hypothetical protein